MNNWTWIEVLWTLVAVLGAYYSLKNVNQSLQDLKVLKKEADKDLTWALVHLVARGSLRRDAGRMIIQVIFIAIGIFAGNVPSPTGSISLLGILVGLSFIVPSGILTYSAIGDYSDRIKAVELGKLIEAKRQHVL